MKKSQRELRAAAGDMLSQLWPPSVLRDARELLLKFQRDEVFREYLAARVWAVLAMLLLFVLISTVCAIDIMFNSVRLIPSPVPVWYRGFALLLGAAVWAGGVVAQIYVFLIVAGHAPLLALLLVALAILAPVIFKKFDS